MSSAAESRRDAPVDQTGFILQATYRIVAGMPVVHLFGRLHDGGTFLVRDYRQRPAFYIAAEDEARARAADATHLAPTSRLTIEGAPVLRVEVGVPGDAPPLRDALHAAGIATFEADVRFAVRYLIDRNVRGTCRIRGSAAPGDGVDWIFDDPEVAAAAVPAISPRVLSFDIETTPDASELLAISMYGCGADEVLIVDPDGRSMPERAFACASEADALTRFCERVEALDPDVLTGWNVIDFDLTVLSAIARRVRRPLKLGRVPGELRIQPADGYFGSGRASIPGRLVLDGIDLLRGAFVRLDDYSLDAVARRVLGEGKALAGDNADRAGEILHRYQRDLAGFATYARVDARLALEIVEALDLMALAFTRSTLTGMTPDRVAASIASFDFLYLAKLHQQGRVAPTVRTGGASRRIPQGGGQVFEPVIGKHTNVWVFDFKSLYPSLIRTFNIDPLTYRADADDDADLIRLSSKTGFSRRPGILPELLDEFFPARERAKCNGDAVASQAIKILMNSFYGVLGTPACRFHNPAVANAITGTGRRLLQWSRDWFEAQGYPVLYGDTDSVFVQSNMTDPEAADVLARELEARMNADLAAHIGETYRVDSRLELEFEKLYTQLLLPAVRGGDTGARKRYAGVVFGTDAVDFVGMEVVRRDWTELAKGVQRELYRRLFTNESVDAYLAEVVARVRAGEMDDVLVYTKGLRKRLDAYTASTPPHVAAARKSPSPPGRLVRYLMTTAGPEPIDALEHPIDHEHYVDRQIRPVAEPVLSALDDGSGERSFDRLVGDDRQISLF